MSKSPKVIDLDTADGMAQHLATLPTANLREIAARPLFVSPTGGNALLVVGAECELIAREARGTL